MDSFKILIADRNRHVREFLRRTFCEIGYQVQIAKDAEEVLIMMDVDEPPDLVVLDLDIPHAHELKVLERLQKREPPVPIVIHSFLSEHDELPELNRAAALVEKQGDVDALRTSVGQVLKNFYPGRVLKAGAGLSST